MVITMEKCTYCHRELLKPEIRFNQPYCNKRCFYEHMAYLSDTNALKTFLDEGPTGISYKQMRSMIRWKLVKYDRDEKTFILTDKAEGLCKVLVQENQLNKHVQ